MYFVCFTVTLLYLNILSLHCVSISVWLYIRKACAERRSKLESLWDLDPSMIDLDLLEMKTSVEEAVEMFEVDVEEENTDEVFDELPDPEDPLM